MLEAGAQIDIWVIESPLGSGGMGSVYRCHNRSASRIRAAVKVLETNMRAHPEAQARFVREAEILFQLDHPNIVKVRNVRTDVDPPYLEMEFVEGESLEERLCRGALPFHEALSLMEQTASAVAYLHRKGVRHRDIKPANLLVKRDGRIKLVDFGLAMEADVSRITQQGMTFGTVSYAPPEWIAPEALDPGRWDLYAMGVVFYEMLSGRVAFPVSGQGSARQQAMQVMVGKQGHKPLDPGDRYPEELRSLIRRLTHADPRQRLGDADEVHRRLRVLISARDDEPTSPFPSSFEDDEDAPSVVGQPSPMDQASDEPTGPIRDASLTWAPTAVGATGRQHTPMPAPSLLDAATAPAPAPRMQRDRSKRERADGTLFHPRSPAPRRMRFAAPLALVGTLAGLAAFGTVVGVAALTWSWGGAGNTRAVDVVVTGLPSSVPVALRLGDQMPDTTEGAVFSFERAAEGDSHITWVIGKDCPPTDCPGLTCPSWCGTGSHATRVEPGTTPQIITVALEPPRGRDVHLLLPEIAADVQRTASLDGRLAVLDGEALVLDQVLPGRHPLVVSAGRCPPDAHGCWPEGDCPPGCTSFAGDLVVPWGTEPHVHTLDLTPPTAVGRTKATAAAAPRRQVPTGARPVTNQELALWLATNPDWQRDAAVEAGRADTGYLSGWDGLRPPSGKASHAATHVSWHAAAAFCRSRGGLADADSEPLRWTEDPQHPWIEFRTRDGRAAWRSSDGRTSTRVNLKSTNGTMGFRCAQ